MDGCDSCSRINNSDGRLLDANRAAALFCLRVTVYSASVPFAFSHLSS